MWAKALYCSSQHKYNRLIVLVQYNSSLINDDISQPARKVRLRNIVMGRFIFTRNCINVLLNLVQPQ